MIFFIAIFLCWTMVGAALEMWDVMIVSVLASIVFAGLELRLTWRKS